MENCTASLYKTAPRAQIPPPFPLPHWEKEIKGLVPNDVSKHMPAAYFFNYSICFLCLGDIEMWKLGMMIQSGKENVVGDALPGDGQNHYGDFTSLLFNGQVFTLSSNFKIEPELYTKRSEFYYAPLLFKEFINKIGNTSVEVVRELYVKYSMMKLCRCIQGLVIVDEHQKPRPHPDRIVKKYSHVTPRIQTNRYKAIQVPSEGVYKTDFRVEWSDTDYNYHTNQFSYLRFSIDCFEKAVTNGCMEGFTGDPTKYKIRTMDLLHLSQTEAGDKLIAYVWEDKNVKGQIHSAIYNKGKHTFQCTLNFFNENVTDSGPSKL